MKELDAVIPYDPVEDFFYINGIGSNKIEATVNVEMCENSLDILNRMMFVEVKIQVP